MKRSKQAEPLTKPNGYRRTDSRLRRYDQLPRYLEGLLVMGDAACVLNPVHAQGITAAAIDSQALSESLQAHFNHPAGGRCEPAWLRPFTSSCTSLSLACGTQSCDEDRRWPAAEVRHTTPHVTGTGATFNDDGSRDTVREFNAARIEIHSNHRCSQRRQMK